MFFWINRYSFEVLSLNNLFFRQFFLYAASTMYFSLPSSSQRRCRRGVRLLIMFINSILYDDSVITRVIHCICLLQSSSFFLTVSLLTDCSSELEESL